MDGVLFVPPVSAGTLGCAAGSGAPTPDAAASVLGAALEAALPHGLRCVCCCSVLPPDPAQCVFEGPLEAVLDAARAKGLDARSIHMVQARIAYINAELDYKLAQLDWMELSNVLPQRFLGLPAKEVI